MKLLEYPENMKNSVHKVPIYMHDKWSNIVQHTRKDRQEIHFHDLVVFVKREARKVNHPIYGKEAMT